MSKLIPPEAYTSNDLAKAMRWRDSQPEHIKNLTNSPESLVSYYKRMQRTKKADVNFLMPNNEFSDDLQNMSQQMPHSTPQQPQPIPPRVQNKAANKQESLQEIPLQPSLSVTGPVKQRPQLETPHTTTVANELDKMTQIMLADVKNGLNLSSDQEALRMLIKLGYQKVLPLIS